MLPRSRLGKALASTLEPRRGLILFLDDSRIPLDDIAAERAPRGVVVGRTNHCGTNSKRGTEVAALFYTLFETGTLSRVDPRA
jgi:transposase